MDSGLPTGGRAKNAGRAKNVVVVVGISGATRAGKSTVASGLCAAFRTRGWTTVAVQQDAFMAWEAIGKSVEDNQSPVDPKEYFPDDIRGFICEVRRRGGTLERPKCVDHEAFSGAVQSAIVDPLEGDKAKLVVAEGFQCFEDSSVAALLDLRLWLDIPRKQARERRMSSKPVDPPSHFDDEIWPAHEEYKARALADDSVIVLDAKQTQEAVVAAAALAVENYLTSSSLEQM